MPETSDLDADRYFVGKDIEALIRQTYDSLGFEVRDIMAWSDLNERAGKDQHAFCLRVGREYPYDVRVLANVRPDSYWMDTMLHEFSLKPVGVHPGIYISLRQRASDDG
jgi:peptidyl-dipeptidase A